MEFDDDVDILGVNSGNLQLYEAIWVLPQAAWLMVFYYFMVDIENFYLKNGVELNNFMLSTYSSQALTWIETSITWINTNMAAAYTFGMQEILIYLSPLYWIEKIAADVNS